MWTLLGWLLLVAPAAAQEAGLAVRAGGAAEGWRPVVVAADLLQDRALASALSASLPLRMRLRVELWEKGFFDRLRDAEEIHLVLTQDPLDRSYRLESAERERRYATLAEAQGALETALRRSSLRPQGRGRFYYLANLEIETLSLSDLEELRRWLRGEVQPAVEGRSSPGRAVGRGLQRVLVRVMGLPTRRLQARSGTFVLR